MAVRQTKQEQHSEEMRSRILTTASRMFREYGFEKVSVRDIAAEVGVTTGTLYHHFKNKQELFFAVGYRKADFMEKCLEQFEHTDRPLEELEVFLGETMTDQVLEDGYEFTQYRVLNSMKIGQKKGRLDRCVEALIRRARQLGQLPASCGVEEAAEYFLWLYRGVVYRYCVSAQPLDLRAEMKRFLRIGITGLRHAEEGTLPAGTASGAR